MANKKYDLAIAYRIYPRVSKFRAPPIFQNDKYKLANLCLRSFKNSLGSLKAKLWVILDDCPPKYEDLFKNYFSEKDLEFIHLKDTALTHLKRDEATFGLQLKILSEQDISEIVYFSEDDYFYFPSQFSKMISFLKNNQDVDIITPYDSLGYYIHNIHDAKYEIKFFADHHWRTVFTSCCSFLTTKKTLQKANKIFNLYYKGHVNDTVVFLCLTKGKALNPFALAKYRIKYKSIYSKYYKVWRYGWKQILFGKKWNVWCPIPTIGTHMVGDLLPPGIDWEIIFEQEIKS